MWRIFISYLYFYPSLTVLTFSDILTGLSKQTAQPQEEAAGSLCSGQAQSQMLCVFSQTRGDSGSKYREDHSEDTGR